jgi:hypothetical protein
MTTEAAEKRTCHVPWCEVGITPTMDFCPRHYAEIHPNIQGRIHLARDGADRRKTVKYAVEYLKERIRQTM